LSENSKNKQNFSRFKSLNQKLKTSVASNELRTNPYPYSTKDKEDYLGPNALKDIKIKAFEFYHFKRWDEI